MTGRAVGLAGPVRDPGNQRTAAKIDRTGAGVQGRRAGVALRVNDTCRGTGIRQHGQIATIGRDRGINRDRAACFQHKTAGSSASRADQNI